MIGSRTNRLMMAGALLPRAACCFLFWIVLAGTAPKDLAAGLVTAGGAAWISARLVPPGELTLNPARLLVLFLRFLGQSVVAGVTVARIALSPNMPLRPGIVTFRTLFAPGLRRQVFTTYASLLPGTLPTGTEGRDLIRVHALGCDQPVAWQLAGEEMRVAAAIGKGAEQ